MPVLFPRAWPNTVINHWMLDSSPSSNQTTALDSVKHKLAIMSVQCEHVQVYIFCRMFNLSSVSLYCKWFFVPKLKWSCMSASVPSNAAQFAETIRATGRRMSRDVLVPALTTTYRLRRGSMHDCHWQLQRSLWWKTSVTWQRLQLRSFLVTCFFLPCPDSSKEAGLVRTHMQGFCRAGLFWKSWVYFFCEVVKHELKMRLEFCYHIVVLALNNKKLDLFKFLQMPFTSQLTAYFYATFLLSNTPTPFCR